MTNENFGTTGKEIPAFTLSRATERRSFKWKPDAKFPSRADGSEAGCVCKGKLVAVCLGAQASIKEGKGLKRVLLNYPRETLHYCQWNMLNSVA